MVYKRLVSTKEYLNMLKRISISNEVTLYVKESSNKQWSCEFEFETLNNENLFTLLDLLDYYLDNGYFVRVKIRNIICYTNLLSDVVKNESEEKVDE